MCMTDGEEGSRSPRQAAHSFVFRFLEFPFEMTSTSAQKMHYRKRVSRQEVRLEWLAHRRRAKRPECKSGLVLPKSLALKLFVRKNFSQYGC